MSFKIEQTSKGKPCIVFENNKFRQYRVLKTGEISWRCLGRTCRAAIKTDNQVKSLCSTNSKHTGSHPVTLRRLSSTSTASPSPSKPQTPSPPSLVTTLNTQSSPSPLAFTPTKSDMYNSNYSAFNETPNPISLSSPPSIIPNITPTCSPSLQMLLQENKCLKEKIELLNKEYKCVLDHSIESDQRLLQYTSEVFTVNTSHPTPSPRPGPSYCEKASSVDSRPPQPSLPTQPIPDSSNEIINSLRTTIEVLEAENNLLRSQTSNCHCNSPSEPFTEVSYKKSRTSSKKPIPLISQNHNNKQQFPKPQYSKYLTQRPINPKISSKAKPFTKTKSHPPTPIKSFPFESVVIEGDSHSRHLAELTAQLLPQRVTVMGVCKPGAKLPQILTSQPQPAKKGMRCDVLIAGTNDVASGEQRNIFAKLESRISSQPANTRLVIATLPHRHDLPATHNINQETALVNAFIEELAARHHSAVLDMNLIQRRYFTRHGMHLRMRGKWQLARLLIQTLHSENIVAATKPAEAAPAPAAGPARKATKNPSTQTSPQTPELYLLPHDTFSDAVKYNQTPKEKYNKSSSLTLRNSLNKCFLGIPLQATNQN